MGLEVHTDRSTPHSVSDVLGPGPGPPGSPGVPIDLWEGVTRQGLGKEVALGSVENGWDG